MRRKSERLQQAQNSQRLNFKEKDQRFDENGNGNNKCCRNPQNDETNRTVHKMSWRSTLEKVSVETAEDAHRLQLQADFLAGTRHPVCGIVIR